MRTGNNYSGARWAHSQRPRRPRRTLTPVKITSKYPGFRSGRVEAWSAKSLDGDWKYERIEDTGTPWEILHVPTGKNVPHWYSSLPNARAATADGTALAELEAAPQTCKGVT